MRDLYSAAWDFERLGLGAVSGANGVQFATTTGGPSGTVGYTTGVYFAGSCGMNGATIDGVSVSPWADGFGTGLAGSVLSISLSLSTLRYTLSSANTFSMTWSGALGEEIRDILGFEGTGGSVASSHTSTKRPKYLICSRVAGQSQVHELYEPSGRAAYVESDNGCAYSISPDTRPLYREWVQPFETASGPTDAEYAGSSSVGGAPMRSLDVGTATKVSWTWQDFVAHVRASMPFALIDRSVSSSGEGSVYKFRGDGDHFDPTRVTADFDGHWTVPFRCRYIGESVAV